MSGEPGHCGSAAKGSVNREPGQWWWGAVEVSHCGIVRDGCRWPDDAGDRAPEWMRILYDQTRLEDGGEAGGRFDAPICLAANSCSYFYRAF